MKSNRFNIPLIIAILLYVGLAAFGPAKKITVWIIGDSTAANKRPEAYPETGWGMKFQQFFDSNQVLVENRALNGRSTLSFRNQGHWQRVLDSLEPGDYVFIEFGHNDEKVDKPGTGVTHAGYRDNLARYITEARNQHAIPVLLTPIARRHFKNGQLENTHKGYPDVVRQLADSLQVPLIDMEVKTSGMLSQLGDEKSTSLFLYVDSGHVNYPKGKKDDTHLSPVGAEKIAGLAAEGVREAGLKLGKYLKDGR